MWIDESGFYLLPSVVRTWAPRGSRPVLRYRMTREHLSVISAISRGGKLWVKVQKRSFNGKDVAGFLRQMLKETNRKLLVIWDGAPIHRSRYVKELIEERSGRLMIERLPGYAPELNPDEGVWRYLKRVEMKNLACSDLRELHYEFNLAVRRLRRKKNVLRGCIKEVGYVV